MPVHIFANFGTSVKGESEDKDHIDWCQIYDLDWSIENDQSSTTEDAETHERGRHKELTVKKKLDKGSTGLANICFKGTSIPEVVIDCYRPAGGEIGGIKYLELRLKKVVITEYEMSLSDGDEEPPEETLKLAFKTIKMTYLPMSKTLGTALGSWAIEMDTDTT